MSGGNRIGYILWPSIYSKYKFYTVAYLLVFSQLFDFLM